MEEHCWHKPGVPIKTAKNGLAFDKPNWVIPKLVLNNQPDIYSTAKPVDTGINLSARFLMMPTTWKSTYYSL